jgi:S-adenosylhomocysteine hydrolase
MDDFKVKDISQAEFGRKEISIAESEMPGLMALREEYGRSKTIKRCKNYWMSSHDNSNCCIDRNLSLSWS